MWINGRDQHLTGRVSMIEVTLNIYGITVKDGGYSITLMIPQLNDFDLGLYKLDVCNIFGCGHFYTTLKVVSEPGSTSDSVLVVAVSGVTVVVILVVIIVVVIVIVKKRRNSTKNTHSDDDNHEYMNQNNNQQDSSGDNHEYMNQDNNQHGERPAVEYVNTVNDVNNVYDVNTVNIQTDDPHVYQNSEKLMTS
ncbi:hybrid signal transduction histidine kinase E-like [Gigantopelta aegis]|uniref:hybrid signal transduction histidine kinase E-like n=1 Tax=Gigantopelta aegis TaxID=1735272 RepID=UPI001B88CAD6|nr:hybrid signal transduction histidine kinase E-like [Gigantopelta aegis]